MKKRLFSLLMVLCLVLSMLPTSAFAADVEYLDSVYITEHNPLYPHDSCSVEEHAPTVDALHPLEGGQYEDDLSVASAAIREAMKNRQSTVSVNVFLDGDTHSGESEDTKALIRRLFHDAYAHTGNPTEGDYLRWVYAEMSGGSSGWKSNGDYYLTFTYNITYYTTAAQEQEVTDKLATVMPAFGFTSATTDYEKVKAIYDYICANVTYDHENLENKEYKLKYTAYAALINGTSVCQGYATLLYRMLLMVGVDARVVTGTAGGGNHGWNIVKLGAYYYNADSTWDAGETEYDYFLTCPANFDPTHTRGADYTTAAFHTAYPMADADYAPSTAPGLGDVTGSGSSFAGGTGVVGDPYLISTKEHLNNVRDHLGAHFKMTNDIVFTDADFAAGGDFYNSGAGWQPIGDNTNKFTGTFDGNGFAIKNLRIDIESDSKVYAGLFGYCNGSTIKNLGMEDSEISVASTTSYPSYAGGIMGAISNGTIANCYNTGSINSNSCAGGISGSAKYSSITNCYNTGDVNASNDSSTDYSSTAYSGGIVGYLGGGTLTNCYNTGSVSSSAGNVYSKAAAGGIIGQNYGSAQNCYNTGSVTASCYNTSYAGGISGSNDTGSAITNCYNTGSVNADTSSKAYTGGIAGSDSGSDLTNCYNIGSVTATDTGTKVCYSYVGGIVGYTSSATITNCYNAGSVNSMLSNTNSYAYTESITGFATNTTFTNCYYLDAIAAGVGNNCTSLTDAQMRQGSYFAGFNFTSVWTMAGHSTYPYPELQALHHINCATHKTVNRTGYAATCYTDGLTDGVQCTVCLAWLTPQTVIPAAHNYESGYCTVCGLPKGLTYTVYGNQVSVTSYTGILTELTIPATIEGKAVTVISFSAFEDCSDLESVTLPGNVTTIGAFAFDSCTSLKSINFPSSVKTIGSSAFRNCTALEAVTLLGDVTAIDSSAFSGCTSLKSINLPASITSLGGSAFYGCTSLKSITVPASITTLGDYLFNNCAALESVTLQGKVTSIGIAAFAGCDALKSIDLPDSVEAIGTNAFSSCDVLADITIPNKVTKIGENTFSFCKALTDITIPNSVKTVAKNAFIGCSSLKSVTFGSGVTEIANYAFDTCSSLSSITFTGDLPTIGARAFSSTTATALYPCNNDTWTDTAVADLAAAHTSVTWTAAHDPKTVSGTPNSCFTGGISDGVQCTICEEWLTPQTPIEAGHKFESGYCTVCGLPEGLTYITYEDRIHVTGYTGTLTELVIPETIKGRPVKQINAYSFIDCTTVKKVTVPNTVTELFRNAFNGCTSLETVILPSTLTAIEENAFDSCTSLTSVNLPEGLLTIGLLAFEDCTALKSISVPDSVTSIGTGAFSGCTALETVKLPAGLTEVASLLFSRCDALKSITLPASVQSVGAKAFSGSKVSVTVRFTGDIPAIADDAFWYSPATAIYPCTNKTWTAAKVAELAAAHSTVTWTADHTPKTVPGTPNSCFTGGLSDGVQCTICEEWLTPQTRIPAAHNYVDNFCTVCGLPKGLTYSMVGNTVTITRYVGPLTELNIPATINGKPVTAIDDYAFDGGYNLKSISLPDSVTYIGNGAFMDCRALENVNIPAGVTAINGNTFSNCKSLKSVNLPAGITAIGNYAFDGCSALESIIIPDGVTDIGNYAFEGCSALKSITFPAAVTSVGKFAFVYCSRLAEVRFLGNAPIFGPSVFPDITATAYYPCGDTTWTETKLQNHGGSITWMVEHHYVDGVCPGCGKKAGSVDGVIRLAGRNRFDTAFQSADALKEVMGVEKFPAAIVTSGMNFADALAGSYLAAVTGAPILLTDNDNMADVIAYIRENVEAGGTVYALGGTAVVADTLKAVESSGFTFKRLAGSNRFATNLMILEEAGIRSGDPVLVCTAYNFADSLSASALGMPILLVDDTVSAEQLSFLRENADGEFILVGGTGAVKPAVETQLKTLGNVKRLAGNNRFDTSVLTAVESFGGSVDYAVLAYGYNFPDGLCAGPLAYALGAPLILTANGDEAAAAVYANTVGITDGFVLGGPSLISDDAAYRIFSTDTVLDGLN